MENTTNLQLYKYLIMDNAHANAVLYTTLPSKDLELFLQAYLRECQYMTNPAGSAEIVDAVEYVKRRLAQDGLPTYWEPFGEKKGPVQIESGVAVVRLKPNNKEE